MPAHFVIILQIENNLSMFAEDTSLRNSMREEFQVCSYPVITFYYWILAQLFSAGLLQVLDFTCGTKVVYYIKVKKKVNKISESLITI